jgi:5-methylcytosine-specific restriction endonuclease McrA
VSAYSPRPSPRSLKWESKSPRRRGRYVAAALRRAVFERDERRCTYADGLGRRCAEIRPIELHHQKAFARGGEHTGDNLTLHCQAPATRADP